MRVHAMPAAKLTPLGASAAKAASSIPVIASAWRLRSLKIGGFA